MCNHVFVELLNSKIICFLEIIVHADGYGKHLCYFALLNFIEGLSLNGIKIQDQILHHSLNSEFDEFEQK